MDGGINYVVEGGLLVYWQAEEVWVSPEALQLDLVLDERLKERHKNDRFAPEYLLGST